MSATVQRRNPAASCPRSLPHFLAETLCLCHLLPHSTGRALSKGDPASVSVIRLLNVLCHSIPGDQVCRGWLVDSRYKVSLLCRAPLLSDCAAATWLVGHCPVGQALWWLQLRLQLLLLLAVALLRPFAGELLEPAGATGGADQPGGPLQPAPAHDRCDAGLQQQTCSKRLQLGLSLHCAHVQSVPPKHRSAWRVDRHGPCLLLLCANTLCEA